MKAALKLTVVFAALLTLIALPSCGGRKHSRVAALPGAATAHERAPVSLDDTLAQLDALARPDGVDEKLWGELTGALRTALTANSHDGKLTSKPPTGEANRVTDLECIPVTLYYGTFDLQWTYKNAGDYDQDGAVNISDITPLALHFGQAVGETNNWIDGDNDGTIGVADIQPIAANYGSEIAEFQIEHATLDGEFEWFGGIGIRELCDITTPPRKARGNTAYNESHEVFGGYWRYRVIPVDSQGNLGEPSEELVPGGSAEIGPEGGTVTAGDGSITLNVPPGAITDTTLVRLRSYIETWHMSFTNGLSCVILPESLNLNLPAELIFNYGEPATGYPEEALTVSKYTLKANPDSVNEPGYTWVTANSASDPLSHSITAHIDSLGYYAVTQAPAQSTSVFNGTNLLAANGNYAFGFGGLDGGELQSFDVSSPEGPQYISSLDTAFSRPDKFMVAGQNGYSADEGWLSFYDLSDPRNLKELSSVWIGDYVGDFTLANGYAYVAAGDNGFAIVDVSDPAVPVTQGRLSIPSSAVSIGIKGDRAYVGTLDGLYIIDIIDPSNPGIVTVLPAIGYLRRTICIVGDYAYCGVSQLGLAVLDLSSPDDPQVLPGLDCEVSNADSLYAYGTSLYLPGDESGVQVIDISNPSQPLLQKVIYTPSEVDTVYVDGSHAYIGCNDAQDLALLLRLDAQPTPESASWIPVPGSNWQMDCKGSYLYIAAGDAGLQIVDISDAAHPILAGAAAIPGTVTKVSSNGDYAAVWADGLYVIDVRNKSNPVLVGSFTGDLVPERMMLDGDKVYFVGYYVEQDLRSNGLIVISIAQPANPSLLWAGYPGDPGYDVSQFSFFVRDSFLYTRELIIYDLTDLQIPQTAAELSLPAQVFDLFIQGDYAYATGYKQLQIIDVSDPSSPAPLSTMAMEGGSNRVRAYGARACVQNWPSMKIIDVSVPTHPILLGDIGNSQWYSEFALSGNYLYVSTAGGILAKDISTI